MSTRVPQVQCDLCRRCGLVWLDAGELAIAQRLHEASPAFRDYQDALARMRSLVDSPERIAAFERNFAQLPDEPEAFDEVLSGLGSALLDCLLLGRRPR